MRDLLFLVADTNMEYALRGFFERERPHLSIGCGPIVFDPAPNRDIVVAAGDNDSGLYKRAGDWLREAASHYRHVVIMIDAEWDGSPGAEAIRRKLSEELAVAGWPEDAGLALVLEPEVDIWLWADSPHVATAMRWPSSDALRAALEREGWLEVGAIKPKRPKEAAEWALRQQRQPRSSALYRKIASRVSLNRCTDPALRQLVEALRSWFPSEGAFQANLGG
jgi:hypothetical protein